MLDTEHSVRSSKAIAAAKSKTCVYMVNNIQFAYSLKASKKVVALNLEENDSSESWTKEILNAKRDESHEIQLYTKGILYSHYNWVSFLSLIRFIRRLTKVVMQLDKTSFTLVAQIDSKECKYSFSHIIVSIRFANIKQPVC